MANSTVEAIAQAGRGASDYTKSNIQALMNAGQIIEFYNPRGIYGGGPIVFPAFLTSFSDSISAEFGDVATYGRMDPIYTFKNTRRTISFAIDIPAEDADSAAANLRKVKRLQSLLYPTYEKGDANVRVISTAPLFQIKFNNLIEDAGINGGKLLGVIPSIEFAPDLEPGMFYDAGTSRFFPKLIKLSITFNPLHSGPAIGFDTDAKPVREFSGTGLTETGENYNDNDLRAGDGVREVTVYDSMLDNALRPAGED
jgi:hypothetical protein